jgi:hypothetical protein
MPKNKHYRDVNGHVMSVWDPNDDTKKTAVFSQIKRLIFAPYRGLKGWVVRLYPGKQPKNLTKSEWKLMERFTTDMGYFVITLFVLAIIAWLTKDLVGLNLFYKRTKKKEKYIHMKKQQLFIMDLN